MSRSPALLLACGGYRSGSTFAYNLLGEHVERALAGVRLGCVEPEQVDLLTGPVWSFVGALGVAVGKAHHSPAIPEGGGWEALLDGRLRPVCAVRDWRDVLHSFCRVYGQGPRAGARLAPLADQPGQRAVVAERRCTAVALRAAGRRAPAPAGGGGP